MLRVAFKIVFVLTVPSVVAAQSIDGDGTMGTEMGQTPGLPSTAQPPFNPVPEMTVPTVETPSDQDIFDGSSPLNSDPTRTGGELFFTPEIRPAPAQEQTGQQFVSPSFTLPQGTTPIPTDPLRAAPMDETLAPPSTEGLGGTGMGDILAPPSTDVLGNGSMGDTLAPPSTDILGRD